jgi:hypothetical protein
MLQSDGEPIWKKPWLSAFKPRAKLRATKASAQE